MKRSEETYILDTLEEVQDFIRSPTIKRLIKETHENNVMLKQIIKFINHHISNFNNENDMDFMRNIFANIISNDINR